MRRFFRYAKFLALPLGLMMPLGGEEPGITRQQADQILDELRQIRQLLEKQAHQPSRPKLNLTGAAMLGSKDAPLTLVEFTDYQCPFCQRFHLNSFPEIKKNYIDTGKVRFYSRDLPLDSIHSSAMRAAQAARCAGEQGQFWTIRDRMGANPDRLGMETIMAYAQELKIDVAAFRACVESGKYNDAIQKDLKEAESVGAVGTPSFVVGHSTADGVEGELMIGALPFADFDKKFKELGAK